MKVLECEDKIEGKVLIKEFTDVFLGSHKGYKKIVPSNQIYYFSKQDYNHLKEISLELMKLVSTMPTRLYNDNYRTMLLNLGYLEKDIEFLMPFAEENNYLEISRSFSRIDYLYSNNGFHVMEFNVGASIGGIGIMDRYYEAVENTLPMFNHKYSHENTCYHFANSIKSLYQMVTSERKRDLKLAFICNPNEVNEVHPHEAAYFLEKEAISSHVITWEKVTFKDDGIYYRDLKLDVLYGCFTFDELGQSERNLINRVKEYQQEKKILFIAPPISTIYGNKGLLSLLKSEEFYEKCDHSERELLNFIPMTSFLTEENLNWVIKKRINLVLKPSIGSGGKRILFGALTEAPVWENRCHAILSSKEKFIWQEYIDTATVSGTQLCIGAVNFNNTFSGFFVRGINKGSEPSTINCTQGGEYTIAYKKCIKD